MELEDLMQETIKIQENQFFNTKFYYSYSSLNKLLWSPAVFYQMYVLGIKEERTDAHLVQGKIVHALLLEEEKFNDQFIISPGKLPGDAVRAVVDRVYAHHVEIAANGDLRTKLEEFDQAVIDVMKDMNYHQSLKTDQQRLDKIISSETTNYWDFLKAKGNKTLIDQDTYNYCKNAVDLMKVDKKLCELIGCNVTEFENKEVFNELYLQCETTDPKFGIKGIIDNLVIDHDKKTIFINDIKTTSKDLKDFAETVEFYSYWMQAIMYVSLVSIKYANLLEQGYEIKFHFVVIDKMFQTYNFAVSQNTLESWLTRFVKVLEKATWHYDNKSYDLPYEFATGSVVL